MVSRLVRIISTPKGRIHHIDPAATFQMQVFEKQKPVNRGEDSQEVMGTLFTQYMDNPVCSKGRIRGQGLQVSQKDHA